MFGDIEWGVIEGEKARPFVLCFSVFTFEGDKLIKQQIWWDQEASWWNLEASSSSLIKHEKQNHFDHFLELLRYMYWTREKSTKEGFFTRVLQRQNMRLPIQVKEPILTALSGFAFSTCSSSRRFLCRWLSLSFLWCLCLC